MAISLSYPDGSYSSSNKPSNETLINDLNLVETGHNSLETKFLSQHNSDGSHTTALISLLYPVGTIYTNASVSTNPNILLGFGTWEAYGTGRVLVGVDTGQTEFDTLGETGGSKTHTLSTAEMPSHTHTQNAHTHTQDAHTHGHNAQRWEGSRGTNDWTASPTGSDVYIGFTDASISAATATNQNTTATNQNTGGGGAHNNLQPYVCVYMWRRTA